ncbi:HD-GYP domain, c-di-GMP phosphodiesterase class II (or its inactivated variant) [Pseudomonas sp. NFPP10]|nr:HD-GYP domain, c-di-GMP phosphodiesterase class II (or its inactivated variant) [Pseudomonas sp. NFPP12]SEM55270.1 HD-GYP domain, c-di-GMP phosphodiesterase class II (or its inactivated variant) [Pseudomonas sp. NFPP10]SFI15205.1 HD-GYP domain, c-di-GMP phosphodiesterase class II (or its inactivated variant) [Pseudomonas sp. NFPP08]SFN46584.1 HD-GYP domain, c-di-GMP phosphodiesterase class II (or its inactivated variant) [Pseudomonas sp. NFPP05]SFY00820.1 HD-GYP domain, c-di-GMP phosphodiest
MGMYIHQFCGSWLDHSFWKAGFVLNSHADLQRLRQSNVSSLWIDSDKGLDLPANPHPSAPAALPSLKSEAPLRVERAEEIQRALKICAHSKKAVMQMFQEVRMGQAIELVQVDELVHNISSSLLRHPDVLISLARLKTADDYTYMHSVAVCALMVAVARQLELPVEQVHQAGVAGLLHDIGKLTIPDSILNKPEKLSADEFERIKLHPAAGGAILRQNPQLDALVLDVCLHHHEKIDGSGYPHHLAGEQISLFAQMGAVCDVYDAVTSTRPYNRGWDPAEALQRMSGWTGHFGPRVLQALVKCVGIYPVGSLVRLNSGKLAVVLEQNSESLLLPKVKVFFSTRSKMPLPQRVLDLSRLQGEEHIVAREAQEAWDFKQLQQLWSEVPA